MRLCMTCVCIYVCVIVGMFILIIFMCMCCVSMHVCVRMFVCDCVAVNVCMHAVSACVVIIGVSVCVLQLPNYMTKYNVASV